MRFGAWQFDVIAGAVEENLACVERGLAQAAEAGLALVVLPELWPTSFVAGGGAFDETLARRLAETDAAVARVAELSREHGLVVAGSVLAPGRGGRPANRLLVHDRGDCVLRYDKTHLFSATGESVGFAAGDAPSPVVETAVGRLGGAICYDLRFGPLFDALAEGDPRVVVVPAQWGAGRTEAWSALLAGRAAELQALVVGCNRVGTERVGRRGLALEFAGASAVAGPDGAVLARAGDVEALVVAEVDPDLVVRVRKAAPARRDRRPERYRAWRDARGPDGAR